ncbi:MAG TPA: hypothetical protein VJA94_03415 [Candidatus Angelobacter sp.]
MATNTTLTLRIRGAELEYSHAGAVCWSLPIESIVLIAEYTTNEGPYLDDYFLVFVTVEQGTFYFATCSFYAKGRDDVLSTLHEQLASPFELELIGSTDWESRVVWPSRMAGKEYFTFRAVSPKTLTEKIKTKLLGETLEYSISHEIQEYLKEQLRSRPV